MTPSEYLEKITTAIPASAVVIAHRITRHRSSNKDGYFRAILTFTDGSRLEVMEYIRTTAKGEIETNRYSYHWMDADNRLKIRWDNAEHYPKLPGFPHHMHDGDEKNIRPCEPMNFFKVLDTITTVLKK